jgi:hypothetical protein
MWILLPKRVCALQRFNAIPKPNECPVIRLELQAHTFVVHLYHCNVQRCLKPISYVHFIPSLAVDAEDIRHL